MLVVTSLLPNGDRQTLVYNREHETKGRTEADYTVKSLETGETLSKETVELTQGKLKAFLTERFGFRWPA